MGVIINALFQGIIALIIFIVKKFAPKLIYKYLTRAAKVTAMLAINILILGASITYLVGMAKTLLFVNSQVNVIFDTINSTSDSYFIWCMQILSSLGILSAFHDFWSLMSPIFSGLFFMIGGRFGIYLLKTFRDNLMYIFVAGMR